jgi:hypothetical protein
VVDTASLKTDRAVIALVHISFQMHGLYWLVGWLLVRNQKEAIAYFMGLSPPLSRGNEGKQENVGQITWSHISG